METIQLISPKDILGRYALAFVNLCNEFNKNEIKIVYNNRDANAKSLLGVLSLCIMKNEQFEIAVEKTHNYEKIIQIIQEFFNDEEM